jgi:putative peptidoglycan lipid II flippase
VGFFTLLSRLFGLIRDQVTAYYFGAGPVADAFFVAFRIPNFLRRLLAEGALTPAFVPVFTQKLKSEGLAGAANLFRGTYTLLILFLLVLTALGLIFAREIVLVLAPGFADDPEQMALTVTLARILFPYILLMSLTALVMGTLNSLGHFTLPALAPVALNLAIIFGAIAISPYLERPIMGLAVGALLGGVLQLALQIPQLYKSGIVLLPSFNFKNPAIWKMLSLMGPAALGGAAYQISILINTQLVSFLPKGSVSWLYYADRLAQFPIGIYSMALATVILPELSRKNAANDLTGFKGTLKTGLDLQLFITYPAMIGLTLMSQTLIELLFQRGNFDPESSRQTANALWAYVLGLPFISGATVMSRAFYSNSNTKTPAVVAAISLGLGLIAAIVLLKPLRHVGLALASSFTAIVNFVWLAWLLRGQGWLSIKPVVTVSIRYFLWSILMGLAIWPLYLTQFSSTQDRIWRIALGLVFGTTLYFGLALVFNCPHVQSVKKALKKLTAKLKK